MTYTVKNGSRVIKFDGTLLAESSSEQPGSDRWIEFKLYLTLGGSYVLERVGVSNVYHGLACPVVERNNLRYDPNDDVLEDFHRPCRTCNPLADGMDVVVLEKDRYYSFISDNPEAIIKSLYRKRREDNTMYMTLVTQRLLEYASEVDEGLKNAYLVEYID